MVPLSPSYNILLVKEWIGASSLLEDLGMHGPRHSPLAALLH